mmetsp:Transcript_68025/g.188232  ORF Transcript_68025/g.188232 Transcript_68025/m.188232 type:complete len:324 (-) Transcript_68025:720-1691(-)
MHRVVHHREVRAVEETLDSVEVEDSLKEVDVVLDAVYHFNHHHLRAAGRLNLRGAGQAEVDVREIRADEVFLDGLGVLEDSVGHLLRRRTAVLDVVLDTEVLVGSARVVRGGEDEGTERRHVRRTALADDGGHGRSRQDTVLANPDAVDTVGNRHLDDDLDSLRVEVASVAAHHKRLGLDVRAHRLDGGERGLHKVGEVVGLHEDGSFLAQARGARFLALDRRGWHLLRADGTEARGRIEVDSAVGVGTRREDFRLGRAVSDSHLTHEYVLAGEVHEAIDLERGAVDEARSTKLGRGLERLHELVLLRVEAHLRSGFHNRVHD